MLNYENNVGITLSIVKIGEYWSTLFERRDSEGYSVAKATVSQNEPSNEKVEKFLKNLNRNKLQFTDPGPEPTTTMLVKVDKKLKYQKEKIVEVPLKNIYGTAKVLLNMQKAENNMQKREMEKREEKEQEEYKRKLKEEKRKDSHKGK